VSTLYRSAFMIQPRGVAQYTRRDGAVVRKRVHGLSHCYGCATLWSRDYAATLNIGRVFVALRGADRGPPSVPLPPTQVRGSVVRRLASLPRFKTRLL